MLVRAILDGFPRTVDQAEALQTMLAEQNRRVDRAVFLTVKEEAVVSRILGRDVRSLQFCLSCQNEPSSDRWYL